MAMPAAQPVQHRYTAGSCILNVDAQPSALSQWYRQPVITALQFRLQMQGHDDVPVLIAEGDRAALLEISHYISYQVRSRLAIAHPGTLQSNQLRLSAPPIPSGLQLDSPLSYLMLCDLSTVLQQCVQQSAILPVELPIMSAEDMAGTPVPTLRVVSKPLAVANAPSDQGGAEPNNVVPISAARRGRGRSAVWASSAAAALLAVGLTTSLLTRPESSSELSATADIEAELLEPSLEKDGSEQKMAKSGGGEAGTGTAAPPDPAAIGPSRANVQTPATSSDSALGSTQNPAPIDDLLRDSSRDIGNVAVAPASPVPDSSAADLPTPPASDLPVSAAPPAISERSASPESRSRGATQQAQPVPEEPAVEPQQQEALADASRETVADDAESKGPERTVTATQPIPETLAEALPPAAPAQGAASSPPPVAVESEAADLQTLNRPETFSADRASEVPDLSARLGAAGESDIAIQQVSATITQVQQYFLQARLRASGSDPSELLSYELQLSKTGELLSFAGLNSAAQTYRDRLLPRDTPLSFDPGTPSSNRGLTLRVDILPSGQVSVYEVER